MERFVRVLSFTVGRWDLLTMGALLLRRRRSALDSGEQYENRPPTTIERTIAPATITMIGLSRFIALFENGAPDRT